jgi:hypothetical protein
MRYRVISADCPIDLPLPEPIRRKIVCENAARL